MKLDEDVRMISAEAPVVFAKACEFFMMELTQRAWQVAEESKRRTLQRSDVAQAIKAVEVFDFLLDIVPVEGAEGSQGGAVEPADPGLPESKPAPPHTTARTPPLDVAGNARYGAAHEYGHHGPRGEVPLMHAPPYGEPRLGDGRSAFVGETGAYGGGAPPERREELHTAHFHGYGGPMTGYARDGAAQHHYAHPQPDGLPRASPPPPPQPYLQ